MWESIVKNRRKQNSAAFFQNANAIFQKGVRVCDCGGMSAKAWFHLFKNLNVKSGKVKKIQLCRVCDACCGETVKDLTESLHVGIAKSRSVFFVRESQSSECIEMDNVVHLVVKHLRLLHVDEVSASSLFRILTTLKRSLGKHFGMAYLIKFISNIMFIV